MGTAFLTSILFAITVTLAPVAYATGVGVELLLFARFLVLIIASFFMKKKGFKQVLQNGDIKTIGIISFALLVQTFGYMTSIKYLPISVAVVLFYMFPLITYLIDSMVKSKGIGGYSIVLLLLGVFGIWLVVSGDVTGDVNFIGVFWVLLSAIMQAVINTASGFVKTMDKWLIINTTSIFPAMFFLLYFLSNGDSIVLEQIVSVILPGLSFCLGMFLFFKSISNIGTVRTANMLYFEPVFTILIAMVAFNEVLSILQWLGMVVTVIAALMLEILNRRKIIT